jgi:hypothetical protein
VLSCCRVVVLSLPYHTTDRPAPCVCCVRHHHSLRFSCPLSLSHIIMSHIIFFWKIAKKKCSLPLPPKRRVRERERERRQVEKSSTCVCVCVCVLAKVRATRRSHKKQPRRTQHKVILCIPAAQHNS